VEVTGKVERLRELCDETRATGERIGFVPTMGALHEGHLSLVRRAREETAAVVRSVFVNPLQFGPGEDYRDYPRSMSADAERAEKEGVDVLFAPDDDVMYPREESEITVDPGGLGEMLEGISRPGHFRGVCTVVAKLFNVVGPCHAYFGEKDFQQLAVVRRLVADLAFPVEVVGCPTVREPDGLACSSRNARLSAEERAAAPVLYRALREAAEAVASGGHDSERVRGVMRDRVAAEPLAALDYAEVVDSATLTPLDRVSGEVRLLLAARFGGTRLIDNLGVTA
jgi:pantoate--beta-alanine ligase